MKKHFGILLWAITLLLLSAGFSWGKVYIDITSPSFRKLPIAIAPFEASLTVSGEMKLGERATDILTHDLDLTGFFALIDPKSSGVLSVEIRNAFSRGYGGEHTSGRMAA